MKPSQLNDMYRALFDYTAESNLDKILDSPIFPTDPESQAVRKEISEAMDNLEDMFDDESEVDLDDAFVAEDERDFSSTELYNHLAKFDEFIKPFTALEDKLPSALITAYKAYKNGLLREVRKAGGFSQNAYEDSYDDYDLAKTAVTSYLKEIGDSENMSNTALDSIKSNVETLIHLAESNDVLDAYFHRQAKKIASGQIDLSTPEGVQRLGHEYVLTAINLASKDESIRFTASFLGIFEKDAANFKPDEKVFSGGEIQNDNADLSDFAKHLKNAKTTINSSEYNTLLSMVADFGRREVLPQAPDLSATDTQLVKYTLIKQQIDAYLTHKGKDGVKHNALDKLEAVEALNRFVSARLEDSEGKTVKVGSKEITVPRVSSSYKAAYARAGQKEAVLPLSAEKLAQTTEIAAVNVSKLIEEHRVPVSRGKISRINDCMSRIILNAMENGRPAKQVAELKKARIEFVTVPSKHVPELERKEKSAVKTAEAGLNL